MNREIKFRVWNGKSKEMIYPSESYNWTLSLDGEVFRNCGTSIKDKEKCVLQQFTGLVDKNENDIYEGDIVNVQIESGRLMTYIVEWCEETMGFRLSSTGLCDYNRPYSADSMEIIGNIFENPELVK